MQRVLLFLMGLLISASPSVAQSATASTGEESLRLRAGDMVRVEVWREKDLSGEFLVNEDGNVTLPLLGSRNVTSVSFREVRERLMDEYRAELRNPSINLTPLRRINVLGEVSRAGLYAVDPTITLAGAVALAGGPTSLGDLNKIRVMRDGQVVEERAGSGETLSSVGIQSGDQIYVDRRSWMDRNSAALLSTGVSLVGSVVTTLIILGLQ
jgi:protein involved in polysaccharide export with SLBB domain